MNVVEFRARPDQTLAVYQPDDTGSELSPLEVFSAVADDAADRAARGEWIVTMTAMPLRHAGTAFGQEGSGYETKVAIAVVYGRVSAGGPTGSAPDRT